MAPQQGDSIETLYVDIAARADELIKDADAAVKAVVKRLDEIDKKTEETERSFSNLGSFIKDALSTAAGIGLAKVGTALTGMIADFGRAMIDSNAQMQMYERSFTTLTGSAEEAGEIIAWVKEQAKATPFDVPGLIEASQQLMTWGLDLEEWFTVVGDTAAAMNRPISQVVNAVGTLASGQTGEAVRRFRDLGINLRDYAELEFDARGAMVTPLEEAIPIVRQIMIERFGGMMESQSDTWAGVMSNMQDTWQQFVQQVGEPVFETLNETLRDLYGWVEQNQDAIAGFAQDLGNLLGTALNALMDIVGWMGQLIGQVDQALERLTGSGIVQTLETGIENARKVGGIMAGGLRAGADVVGGLAQGKSLGQASEDAAAAALETMNAVAGVEDASRNAADAQRELNEAQLAGVEAARALNESYQDLTDTEIENQIAQGAAAEADLKVKETMAELGLISQESVEAYREQTAQLREMASAYNETSQAVERNNAQIQQGIERYQQYQAEQEAVAAQQQENIELAGEVASKLTERLQDALDDYVETIKEATEETAEAIREIEAKAAQAEAEAISSNQADIAKLRDDHAREQMRRRRQFNLEWARLIREQNQENLDAEWEYQYQKDNLLIEGDEIALAELEARYKHESEVRAREQGDARSDTQADFALEEQARQEQYELQLQQLEARLQEEIAAIRARAQAEVESERQALEEKMQNEEAALEEKMQKIGAQLAEQVEGNQTAAQIVMEAWRTVYGDEIAQAVNAGVIIRQEMDAIIQSAISAQTALAGVSAAASSSGVGTPNDPNNPRYAVGGYTPMAVTDVTTHPGEFISDAATTAAMERATGGPLTQSSVRSLASKQLDVSINAAGLPADMAARIERELIDALRDEATF